MTGRAGSGPGALVRALRWSVAAGIVVALAGCGSGGGPIVVGSKHFNEGYILAEILAQLLEDRGFAVERRFGLGGTMVCYRALTNGEIDLYPEYTGTIQQAILKMDGELPPDRLAGLLRREQGLRLLDSFGFNNTYVLAVRRQTAARLGLETISDLRRHRDLRFGFSYEFVNREDGWIALAAAYRFDRRPVGLEHGLAYQALDEGAVDVIDVYATDAEIARYDLKLLDDDLGVFPTYLAAPLLRDDLDPRVAGILAELAGTLDEERMRSLNAAVMEEGRSFAAVARGFLERQNALRNPAGSRAAAGWEILAARTLRHVQLTLVAVVAGLLIAVPFGVVIYRVPPLAKPVLYVAGLLQTIPSIALLAFMIPLFGIGAVPAVVALFLYALLPILRNTHAALASIDPVLKRVAIGMGLSVPQRLRYVEIPLAMPTILAGVRTATVINIGTATLAAFIGAGGLGEPIVTGLALNDTGLILEGAVPAAMLAVAAELMFEALERVLVPGHLLRTDHQ